MSKDVNRIMTERSTLKTSIKASKTKRHAYQKMIARFFEDELQHHGIAGEDMRAAVNKAARRFVEQWAMVKEDETLSALEKVRMTKVIAKCKAKIAEMEARGPIASRSGWTALYAKLGSDAWNKGDGR